MSYKNTTREERAKNHHCDGDCYGEYTGNGMCGSVDSCPETRNGEFFGVIAAIATIIGVPIVIVVAGIIFLITKLYQ